MEENTSQSRGTTEQDTMKATLEAISRILERLNTSWGNEGRLDYDKWEIGASGELKKLSSIYSSSYSFKWA